MSAAFRAQQTSGESLFDFPSEQLIAIGRVFLTVFALAAVWVDVSSKERDTYEVSVLLAYFAFAALLAVLVLRRPLSPRQQISAHLLDVAAVSALMVVSSGPTSPFFVFYTFILLASTIRWNGRGALATAALLTLVYAAIAFLHFEAPGAADDLTRTVIRAGFLLVAGAMLGYVGAYRERSRRRLAELVAWPGADRTARAAPPISAALAHVAALLRAPRVLVIWEQPNEPFRKIALLSDGQVRHSRQPATRFGSLVAPPYEAASVRVDTSRSAEAHPEGGRVNAPRLDPDLCATFQIRTALTAPFERDGCHGRVFVIDPTSATDDDILLVKLIARRIGVDLEHYLLRHEIQMSTALRERERLGRDLHDGLLQSLAAVDIRLKLSADRGGGDLRAELEQTRSLLADEQNRIRAFVEAHRPLPKAISEQAFYDSVAERVRDLGRQWNCEITLDVCPPDLQVQSALAQHLRHLLSEAVSNAARHGPSSRIHITIARCEGGLSLTVTDNGNGFPGLNGSYEFDELRARRTGPISVLSRVADLAGTLKLESFPAGSRIQINLPL